MIVLCRSRCLSTLNFSIVGVNTSFQLLSIKKNEQLTNKYIIVFFKKKTNQSLFLCLQTLRLSVNLRCPPPPLLINAFICRYEGVRRCCRLQIDDPLINLSQMNNQILVCRKWNLGSLMLTPGLGGRAQTSVCICACTAGLCPAATRTVAWLPPCAHTYTQSGDMGRLVRSANSMHLSAMTG